MKKIHFDLPDYILEIIDTFKKNGYEVFLVGGCIRDLLLNKTPHDYDLATSASEQEVKELFKEYHFIIPNGAKHGTYTLRYKHHNIEITSFKHSEDEENNFKNDTNHRDLTINAFGYDGEYLYDYHNGEEDLANHIISMGEDPSKIVNEDPLRILRAIRFQAELGFDIEDKTKEIILSNYQKLSGVSKERIINEISHILVTDNIENILLTYHDIFGYLFPPLIKTFDYDQNNRWHPHDLYVHTVHVVKNTIKDRNTRLAALLHDIGKVDTMSQEYIEGVGYINHYYGHPLKSGELAKNILNTYKLSSYDKDEILFLIVNHDNKMSLTTKSVRKMLIKITTFNDKDPLITLNKLLSIQLGDHKDHTWFVPIEEDKILEIAKKIIEEKDALSVKDLAIDGRDMQRLGFQGKAIGDILKEVLRLVSEEELKNDRESLLSFIKSNY